MTYIDRRILTYLGPLIVLIFSVVFYILKHKTKLGKKSETFKAIVIGGFFSLISIYCCLTGTWAYNSLISAKDAAVICSGLFFGGPAGIVTGVLTGAVRLIFSDYVDGVVWAEVLTPVLTSINAAFIREYVFDGKRPTWSFAFATALMSIALNIFFLFVFNLNSASEVVDIIQYTTLPLIICVALPAGITAYVLSNLSKIMGAQQVKTKVSVSRKIQISLLITITVAFIFTSGFVLLTKTNTEIQDADVLISVTLMDVKDSITTSIKNEMISKLEYIKSEYDNDSDVSLYDLKDRYAVSEISIAGIEGKTIKSTVEDYIGFDFGSGSQSEEFLILLTEEYDCDYLIQDYREITYPAGKTMMYGAIRINEGGFLQIGNEYDRVQEEIREELVEVSRNRHIGNSGMFIIADNEGVVISDNSLSCSLADIGLELEGIEEDVLFKSDLYGSSYFCMYEQLADTYIIGCLHYSEVLDEVSTELYTNGFMEILIFFIMFILIFLSIKRLVVNNINHVNDNLNSIISGNLDTVIDVRDSNEFDQLSTYINKTVDTLKTYIEAEKTRLNADLDLAKSIQASTLPTNFSDYDGYKEFNIFASMNTAKEVGGDFYDFYMRDREHLIFLVADVSGKGIPAAMFMMKSKTIIRSLTEQGLPLDEVLTKVNSKLCAENKEEMFVTCWMGELDILTGELKFVSCGHNPPLLYRKSEDSFEYLKSKNGLVLAGFDGFVYKINELQLTRGDKIFLYTDGVTEATDINDELYSEPRLRDYLNSHSNLSVEDTLHGVKEDIDVFVKGRDQFDDITMLMVNFYGTNKIEKVFKAQADELENVNSFIEGELEKMEASPRATMQVMVSLEEIFINIASYAYRNKVGDAIISFEDKGDIAEIVFKDFGSPFNPLDKDDPDITLSAEDRDIGGLGIFMVKQTMDEVIYEYKNNMNILTIKKVVK